MAVVPVDLIVPDDIYVRYLSGEVLLMGLAKDASTKKIVKHLDASVTQNGKAAVYTAIGVAVGLVIVEAIHLTINLVQKAKAKRFQKKFDAYLDAIKNKELTKEIIVDLLIALLELKGKTRERIALSFSSAQITAIIDCLCEYTQRLAEENKVQLKTIDCTQPEDELSRLKNTLCYQIDVFKKAS